MTYNVSTHNQVIYGIVTKRSNVQHVLRSFGGSMCGRQLVDLSMAPSPVLFLCMQCRGIAESELHVNLELLQ